MDLWYIFACLSLDLLKQGGYIASLQQITGLRVVEQASSAKGETTYRHVLKSDAIDFLFQGKNNKFAISFSATLKPQTKDEVFTFVDKQTAKILNGIEKIGAYCLKEDDVAQDIVLPQDFIIAKHLSKLNDKTIQIGDGIFNISPQEKKRLKLTKEEEKIVKPFYTTNELTRYYESPSNSLWVIYTTTETIKNIKAYPNIKAHLDRFKSVITSDFKPCGLHRARSVKKLSL